MPHRSRRSPRPLPPLPEAPLSYSPPSRTACLGLYLATRAEPAPRVRAFRDRERVIEALGHGILAIDETIRVRDPRGRLTVTTVGRFLAAECLPPALRDETIAKPLTARRLAGILARVLRDEHVEIAACAAEALELLGRTFAERSGASLGRHDFQAPEEREAILAEAVKAVKDVQRDYDDGLVTDGERYNKSVEVWSLASDQIRYASKRAAPERDPLAAFAAAEADGWPPEQVRGIRGAFTKHTGEIYECPVLHTFGDGLSAHEYMMTCVSTRAGLLDQKARDEVVAPLFHDLLAVLEDTVITVRDCGSRRGILVRPLESPFAAVSLAARIEGRIAAADVTASDCTTLARAGDLLTRRIAERVEAAGVSSVLVRDPLTCAADDGVCALCFGLDPDDATWPCAGDPMGARAAVGIARAASAFYSRPFHIC